MIKAKRSVVWTSALIVGILLLLFLIRQDAFAAGSSAQMLKKVEAGEEEEEEPVEIEELRAFAASGCVQVGSTYRSQISVYPTLEDFSVLEWESEDETIAVPDGQGNIIGVSEGLTRIHVSTKDGKKKCTFSILVVSEQGIPIDEDHFPDEAFRSYVSEYYDAKPDDFLTFSEIQIVNGLMEDFDWSTVSSLKGIEYFPRLHHIGGINLTVKELDLSYNLNLMHFVCENGHIEELCFGENQTITQIACINSHVKKLDVSGCSNLNRLECMDNELEELDLSGCEWIDLLRCQNNQLKTFVLDGKERVHEIDLSNNKLEELRITDCPHLMELTLKENELKKVVLSGCESIETLDCSNNQLTSLFLEDNIRLVEIRCSNNQLKTLDLRNLGEERRVPLSVFCDHNLLEELYIADVVYLDCSYNQLMGLSLEKNEQLETLICSYNLLTSLDLSEYTTRIGTLVCDHNDLIELKGIGTVTTLDCSYNRLRELSYFGGWTATLNCSHNMLESLDLTNCTGANELICDDNQLTELNLRQFFSVKKISAVNNKIRCVDLRNIPDLESCDLDDSTIIVDADHGLGWREQNGNTYYIEEIGLWPIYTRVVTGWKEISGTEYFFTPEGVLVEGAIRLNEVTIRALELGLTLWDTETLTAVTDPVDFPTDSLTWSSENEDIVKVDATGKVTPVSIGSTFITVSSAYDIGVSYTIPVTVREILSLETQQMDLMPGEQHQFYTKKNTPLVTDIAWEIVDPLVASISGDGVVTAFGEGVTELVITATGSDGRKKIYHIPITVTAIDSINLYVEKIEFRQQGDLSWPSEVECMVSQIIDIEVLVYVKDPVTEKETTYQLNYDKPVAGTGAGSVRLIWKSTNPDVASVSNGRVEILSKGSAFITAQVLGLNVSSMMDLTANGMPVPLRSIALSESVYTMNIGTSKTFSYTLSPRNVDADQKKVLWKTSDPEIATVDANGRVTAVGTGKAEIEAYSAVDDNIYASVEIYVQSPVESITMEQIAVQEEEIGFEVLREIGNGDEIILTPGSGNEVMISAYVNKDADNKKLEYELEPDDGALSVEQIESELSEDPDGRNFFRITAVQAGETKVYIRSTDGSGIYGSFIVKALPNDGWITGQDGTKRHYTQGEMDTGWQKIDGKKYYFGIDGILQTGWKQIDKKWYFLGKDGIMRTGWQKVGKWYFFGTDGIMKTGWQKYSGKWYLLGSDGAMKTGWQKVGKSWYYLGTDGIMRSGWQKVGKSWYYFGTDGIMRTGWQKVGKNWYYFGTDGIMRTGWQKIGKSWYFFSNGAMKTGWKKSGGAWYYFDSQGVMVTGSRKIGSGIYNFSSAGICLNP